MIEAGKRGLSGISGSSETLADSLGVASFGPICLDRTSSQYGSITSTPKQAWINFPVLEKFIKGFGFDTDTRRNRVFFDTDVNVPAMFEFVQAQQTQETGSPLAIKESLCYVTVGTGVGIGLIINGKCVHGLMHPEGGHARVPISPLEESKYENFKGVCSFHGNCIEGLVSNVAIK